MKKYLKFTLFLFIFNPSIHAQEMLMLPDGSECSMEGSAKRQNDKAFNRLKNRFTFPQKSDFDTTFNWDKINEPSDDRRKFNARRAVILRGYVVSVSIGSIETCNCNSLDPAYRDTHITLAPNEESKNDKTQYVVAEVTPRMRIWMKEKGIDWSQKALKKLKGQTIELEGWLFYDFKHGDKSAKVRPNTEGVNRATAWEIHPIMRITVL